MMPPLINSYMTYQFVRRLVTPFTQMPAFHLGIIDENGDFLKDVNTLTDEEKSTVSLFDILVINLKRLLGKLPGGRTRLASFAAALYLLRQHNKVNEDTINNLEEDFNSFMIEARSLMEDAPTNATGSAVAGTNGDTIVTKKAAKSYKEKNRAEMPTLLRRKPPVNEAFDTFFEQSTLEYHKELNPKIWENNGTLKNEVRIKLLQIAEAWRMFAKIPVNKVIDIILTGGNANFNYTSQSDLDLHLIIDRNDFAINRDMVDEYLQDKKILWTLTHNDINIYGYPVELYAQHVEDQLHEGQGVYDVSNDEWIQVPVNLQLDFNADPLLQKKVEYYKQLIDKLIADKADSDTMDKVKDKIRSMRGAAIEKGGEFSFENLVFKELRNLGYLDKMDEYEKEMKDKDLSL